MEMQTSHVTGQMMWLKYDLRNESSKGLVLFTDGKVFFFLKYVQYQTLTTFKEKQGQILESLEKSNKKA